MTSLNLKSSLTHTAVQLFGRALHSLATRLYPTAGNGAEAVDALLTDSSPGRVRFAEATLTEAE